MNDFSCLLSKEVEEEAAEERVGGLIAVWGYNLNFLYSNLYLRMNIYV